MFGYIKTFPIFITQSIIHQKKLRKMSIKKLSFSHETTEIHPNTKKPITQEMVITANYDTEDDGLDNIEVKVFQNGKFIAEISGLLDNAEGNPLSLMLGAIDWRYIAVHQG